MTKSQPKRAGQLRQCLEFADNKLMKKKCLIMPILLILFMFSSVSPAHASVNKLVYGTTKVVTSVFAIPMAMIEDSGKVMFPFGLLTGAVRGTMNTALGVTEGAINLAAGAAPYAKYLLLI